MSEMTRQPKVESAFRTEGVVATNGSTENGKAKRSLRASASGRTASKVQIEPPPLLDWTGERCVPWAGDLQVVYEHYHRYLFASALAQGRRVLDLGCGEGYGAALLATQASDVVAVDIDQASIDHARIRYSRENLSFNQADMGDLSNLADASFDLVTCFEALEHVSTHDRILAEVLRVLTPEGFFLVSTPDQLVYSLELENDNPFHMHEFAQDEFVALLSTNFPQVRLWGQNVAVGSVIVPLEPDRGSGEVLTLMREHDGWTPGVKLRPTYILALASRAALPELPDYSTLIDIGLELLRKGHRDETQLESTREAHEQAELNRQLMADHDQALRSLQRVSRRAEGLEQRQSDVLADIRATRYALGASMAELDELKSGALFPLLERYRRSVERVAPAGSLRRRGYRRLIARAHGSSSSSESGLRAVPSIRASSEPEVSIIIPVHNKWEITVACLRSLEDEASSVPYEVIAVDDASTDETRELLSTVTGVRVVRLEQNAGFVGAVNAGLRVAKGRFIVLLNNDTSVLPGWLEALVKTVEVEENVGIVGAKLIYPDGRLQEAGGIVWRDGSGWNYGKGGDAADPAFNFLRDVDYCSGACLLVRKDLVDALGGLDRRFAPAYYEDTDLAFGARKLGYRVVYQPEARVVHLEGASHGTNERSGIKRYQEVNRAAFRLKWEAELEAHAEGEPPLPRLASRHAPTGRVLVIEERVPMPNQDSGSRRMFEMLLLLRDLGLAVTLVPNDGHSQGSYSTDLQQAGIEVLYGPLDRRGLLLELAPGLDLAILSRPDAAWPWHPLIQEMSPSTKFIYDTVDLHFVREGRRAQLEGDPAVARAAGRYHEMELFLARTADATFVVSEEERQVLLAEQPGLQVHVVPNIHREEDPGRPFEEREGLLFVGSFPHLPNRDAAHWLVEEIMPLVRQQDSSIPTYIVGSHPTEDILALASEDVRVLGWVPDLRDLYARARLSVAPLRYGAGVKGKVGESLAYGLPVVTTPLGAEGMGLEHERDVLVAEGADAFSVEIVRAYHDAELWRRLALNGRCSVARGSSPTAVRSLLAGVLGEMGVKVRQSGSSGS